MKGKPFLVAFASFVIVLFGGVAIAGVGVFGGDTPEDAGSAAPLFVEPVEVVPEAEATTTTEATKAPEPTVQNGRTSADPAEKAEESDTAAEEESEEKKEPEKPKKEEPVDLFSITKPEDGAHVTDKLVRFGGSAGDDVTVHRGKYTATPTDGVWTMDLVLSPGKNKVSFEAIDSLGNTEIEWVTVYYDAPKEDEKPKEDPKDVTFTANQKYGSCGDEVPYDKFWGTAPPGSKITASSPYGGATTTADKKGNWYLKVTFPGAPAGETFKVTITSSEGGSKTFEFTNTGKSGKDH